MTSSKEKDGTDGKKRMRQLRRGAQQSGGVRYMKFIKEWERKKDWGLIHG